MPRDLFGDVTRPSISVGTRKWYTVPLSLLSHAAIVLVLIALPILAPAVMPSVFADDDPTWILAKLPTPPPPPTPRRVDDRPIQDPTLPPIDAPDGVAPEVEVDRPPFETTGPDVIGGDIEDAIPPPPVVVQQVTPPAPVRVGGVIRTPQKTRDVSPVYPQMAVIARVQGIVIVEATIGVDGQVTNARILRSVPLLDQAAIDAVRQWQFTPSHLNGVPVPVIMTVTVNFTLK